MSFSPYNTYLLLRQSIQPVHHRIDQPVRPLDPLQERQKLAQRALELGPERLRRLPAGRIDDKLLPVLLEHCQKALVIVLVVALQFGLGRVISEHFAT